jgi:cytochrome c biogenesis protein CcdA
MDAFQIDILRRLDELRDHQERLDQRLRALLLVAQRQEAAHRAALKVAPPPASEMSPAPQKESAIARFVAAGGWPAAALLLSCVAPLLAGVLVWAAWATNTPLPTLILALFGVADAVATPH